MKLEFLVNGAPDCPLIRLYAFTHDEVRELIQICSALSTASLKEVALHSKPWIESVLDCELYLCSGDRDLGIVGRKSPFTCALTKEAWAEVAAFAEPFAEGREGTGHYQWLNEDGPTSLLLSDSADGGW